jgi:hypothetical protein
MGARQSSPSMTLISLGSGSNILTEASSITWKNKSADNDILWVAAFTNSSASVFLLLSMYSTVNPLKWFSILLMRAKYFSRVSSLAMHSFYIWLETTIESMQSMHVWTPMALNLWIPSSMASYSTMLFMHFICFVGELQCGCVAQFDSRGRYQYYCCACSSTTPCSVTIDEPWWLRYDAISLGVGLCLICHKIGQNLWFYRTYFLKIDHIFWELHLPFADLIEVVSVAEDVI